jgi:hypothetical protein
MRRRASDGFRGSEVALAKSIVQQAQVSGDTTRRRLTAVCPPQTLSGQFHRTTAAEPGRSGKDTPASCSASSDRHGRGSDHDAATFTAHPCVISVPARNPLGSSVLARCWSSGVPLTAPARINMPAQMSSCPTWVAGDAYHDPAWIPAASARMSFLPPAISRSSAIASARLCCSAAWRHAVPWRSL